MAINKALKRQQEENYEKFFNSVCLEIKKKYGKTKDQIKKEAKLHIIQQGIGITYGTFCRFLEYLCTDKYNINKYAFVDILNDVRKGKFQTLAELEIISIIRKN
jgi:hypothetical protein